jgi:hypothetical protein
MNGARPVSKSVGGGSAPILKGLARDVYLGLELKQREKRKRLSADC